MKKITLLFAFLLASATLFAQTNYSKMQDVVYLKNGSVIRGYITEQVPNQSLRIETRDGSIIILEFNQIEKISKEKKSKETRVNPRVFEVKQGIFYTFEGGILPPGAVSLNSSIGIQMSSYISTALSFGFDADLDYGEINFPLYLDTKVYVTKRKITPYFYNKLGGSFSLLMNSSSPPQGYYFGIGSGLRINTLPHRAYTISLGYKYDDATSTTEFFAINFGLQF